MATLGEQRRAKLVPETCPLCGRRRQGDALRRHLVEVHSAVMLLLEAEGGEQFWPIEEAEVVRKR